MSDDTKPVVTMMLNAMSPETQAKLLAEQELGLGSFLKHVAKDVLHVAEKVVGGTAKVTEKVVEDVAVKAPVAVIKATNKAINKTVENSDKARAAKGSAKTASEFEKLHPRGPDGRFTDEPGGTGGLLPKPENLIAGQQNKAAYDQYKRKFVDWTKKSSAYYAAEQKKRREEANTLYDSADNRLSLAAKYAAQLEDAKKVGAIGQYKKLQSNVDKNKKQAEEFRLKGDALVLKTAIKPYHKAAPVPPKGVQEAIPPPAATGQGLLPKPPTVKLPAKTVATPTKVPRLTDLPDLRPGDQRFPGSR